MKDAKSRGRAIGLLLLVQLSGLIVPFIMLHPMTTTDFLMDAAAHASEVKLAVLLLLANCAVTISISIVAFPVFRQHGEALAVLLVSAGVVMFSLQAVDNSHLMAMLSLSEGYVQRGRPEEFYQALSTLAQSTRRWAHYPVLLAIDTWICVLYGLLYRYRLVPRALSLFGLITVLLHFTAIPLPLLLGYGGVTFLGVPMAFSHVALALWLTVKGLEERPRSLYAQKHEVELAGA